MRRTAPTGTTARARSEVRPLNKFERIMLPVPPWRLAPFGAPAAFDVNLCTDSVLPGSLAPGPVTLRLGFVATSLRHSMKLEYWMGPFPALTTPRNSILTDLQLPFWPAVPSLRGLHLVYAAWEFSGRKPRLLPPKTHSLRLFAASLLGFLQKNCVPRALHSVKALRVRTREPRCCNQTRKTLCDLLQRDPNSRTGACECSSQYPAPGR